MIPIVTPSIDSVALIKLAKAYANVSLNAELDSKRINPHTCEGYLELVQQMNDTHCLSRAVLNQLFFSFLTYLPEQTYYNLIQLGGLKCNSLKTESGFCVVLISGTLLEWKETIIHGGLTQNTLIKKTCKEAYNYFRSLGLNKIFDGYTEYSSDNFQLKKL